MTPRKAAALLLLLGLCAFAVLTGLAAAAYPGGTYCEPDADRYRFFGNYFCDLTASVTARGEENARSAAFAQAAFVAFGLAATPFFWLLGGFSERPWAIRALGVEVGLATVLLAWLPSRAGATLHAVSVFSATIPGLVAAALGVYRLRSHSRPALRVLARLGMATFAAAVADAAGFAYAVATHAGCLPWLPALQKVVALLFIAWMLATAAVAARTSG